MNAMDDTHELDSRTNEGIVVRLLWQRGSKNVIVAVVDTNVGDGFRLDVPGNRALDAFQHPYAYAAFDGVDFAEPRPQSVHA